MANATQNNATPAAAWCPQLGMRGATVTVYHGPRYAAGKRNRATFRVAYVAGGYAYGTLNRGAYYGTAAQYVCGRINLTTGRGGLATVTAAGVATHTGYVALAPYWAQQLPCVG